METRSVIAALLGVITSALSLPSVSAEGKKPVETKPVEKPVEKDPAAKPDDKVKPYPLDTCIVSDEKLGGMWKPVSFIYEGKEIELCCKHCRKDFDDDPAGYLKKLEGK